MSNLPNITLSRKNHRKENQILIGFKHDWVLIDVVKHLPKAKWSATLKSWYVKDTPENLKLIYSDFKSHAYVNSSLFIKKNTSQKVSFPNKRQRILTNENRALLNNFYKYLIGKRYSKSTVKTYSFFVADFIEFNNNKTLNALTIKDVNQFIERVFIKRQYSISSQHQFISAV